MGKAERTRQLIAQKTAPVFNKKGFEATSLTDLTRATGLTKGALYGNFRDKREIRVAAFKYAMQQVKHKVDAHLADATTYKGRLLALVHFYASYVLTPPVAGGCPLLNTAIEEDDVNTSLRKAVVGELNSTIGFIESLLNKGVAAGEFISDINPRELAYVFFCSVEGALMFSRVERSALSMNAVVAHCKSVLDQIEKK